ncbi:MAG: Phosphoribosylformylglycinamidine synthase 2 [Marinimicrobia bacterium 46_47]|nr:MAG: Phosphoribosylformylglycinamidine synthase 2 [Marinimicrobia bacterium 46_47]KUK91050.1 MAG: phosphoribosylformylglycinamidine synthase [Marinimicrobia bacterium 46_43]
MPQTYFIQLILKDTVRDVTGERVKHSAKRYLNLNTGRVKSSRLFTVRLDVSPEEIRLFAESVLRDPVMQDVYIGTFYPAEGFARKLLIAKRPGVTDDEGISAQKALGDILNRAFSTHVQQIYTADLFYFEKPVAHKDLITLGEELLGNPLINHFEAGPVDEPVTYVPDVRMGSRAEIRTIPVNREDNELLQLSSEMLLSLNLDEMKTIRDYFNREDVRSARKKAGLNEHPTDCELEILGQTWSEHCKHKEFNALIHFRDEETGQDEIIDSLFKTYIRKSTDIIRKRFEKAGNPWLLKVFTDNAGVVRINEDSCFIWKVETHNSPSALDPYGGALTGIVGVNRDPLGTGIGGARLLFNTNVLCFGNPDHPGELLPGQLHPRRIMTGVVKGIEDGGNKSGIPTINGSVIFDNRFSGKPLVFCGTAAVMPLTYGDRPTWIKSIDPGDRIVMAGGRVGKDGIHGATFSSLEIDEHSPRSAVQIGSPITQKNMSDFMVDAARQGLIKCSTDNGAGGLSSSIGELAQISGGAEVYLDQVPLKYPGLQPWEIFVSESQERMTLVIEPDQVEKVFDLAKLYDVEVTDIGCFTGSGHLKLFYEKQPAALLDLDFLHNGVPRKHLEAVWKRPDLQEPERTEEPDIKETLLALLGSLNICSRESIIRRYDHEVKGRTVVKPLMGEEGHAPQDAGVIRLDFDSWEGIAVSNGIMPKFGDIDAYEASAGAFDEAVRQIISVGGRLPDPEDFNSPFWSVNDNFCVPDSVYDPETNPDGKYKLAQLVRMNQALFDMATTFNIPMTSGKDSMKNDFRKGKVKISVPPTVLYSMAAKIDDIRTVTTSDFKRPGDAIYLVGKTRDELGGSEFYRLLGYLGAHVPKVHKAYALNLYRLMGIAHREGFLASSHDLSDGGLAVALAECVIGGPWGAAVDVGYGDLPLIPELFSESHSRFVVSVPAINQTTFENLLGSDARFLGAVLDEPVLKISFKGEKILDVSKEEMLERWRNGLVF